MQMEEGGEKQTNLEIGARDFPLVESLREDLVGENPEYVFFDYQEGAIWETANAPEFPGEEKRDKLALADMRNLPMADGSLNLLMVNNVFGHEGYTDSYSPSGKDKVDIGSKEDLAKEWARALEPGGHVVIGEWTTPPDFDHLKNIVSSFKNNGFELTEVFAKSEYRKNPVEELPDNLPVKDMSEMFGSEKGKIMSNSFPDGSYGLVLTKRES